ncbi:hypothetical protein C8F04DRAFT_1179580 [Mycena alexandri]|uniref:Uncharacterized protein n=1 Tax=Mycena alexandri TaxID=1745969 RepID=A0AAD6T2I8_9AGAR|nr:hypothetical protein C8F04DRAFT_1179580 [Mycena alexandri]
MCKTKRRFLTAFLLLNIVVHLGFSYASAILVLHFRTSTASATTASNSRSHYMLCDGHYDCDCIALHVSSALKRRLVRNKNITSIIRRLIVLVFTSGVAVASVTLFTLVLMLKQNPGVYFYSTILSSPAYNLQPQHYTVFFFIKGRIYALTIVGSSYAVRNPPESTLTLTSVSLPTTIVSGNFRVGREGDSHTSPQVRSGAAYGHLNPLSALLNVEY